MDRRFNRYSSSRLLYRKKLKFPAPWLVGGMLTVAIVQTAASSYVGYNLQAYWPHSVMILSQIFIASSIGSRFHKEMFIGVKKLWLLRLLIQSV